MFNNEKKDDNEIKEYKRNIYDDTNRRNNNEDSFKNRKFNGKKIIADAYTSEKIHSDNKFKSNHNANVDHTTPLKELHKRYGNSKYIKKQDIKEFANSDLNLRVTSESFNKSKGQLTNIEYLKREIKTDGKIDSKKVVEKLKDQGTYNMVSDQIKSEATQKIYFSGKLIVNISEKYSPQLATIADITQDAPMDFTSGAISSIEDSSMIIMVNGVKNLCLVATGEKDFHQAVKDTGELGVQVAITGGSKEIVIKVMQRILKENTNKALENVLNSNVATQIITVSLLVKDSLMKYINSEITGEEFIKEIGMQGVQMLSGTIGAIAGQALIPIPIIGAFIGSVVISTICVEICKTVIYLRDVYKSLDGYDERLLKVNEIASEAINEIEKQQVILKDMINEQFAEWDNEFNFGIDEIFNAAMNNNVEGIANGLYRILGVFEENVKFKTYEEFDKFFMEGNNTLTL